MILLALLLQAAPPAAPPAPPSAPPSASGRAQPPATIMAEPVALAFAGWDADGDGRTTRAEAVAGARRGFAAIDGAASGRIGYIGFADWAERWLGDRNALPSPWEVDSDADDRITAAELDAALGRIFDRLDRDRDGALARAELLTIRPGIPEDRRRRRKGGDTPPPAR